MTVKISISGSDSEARIVLGLLIEDFLKFTGFEHINYNIQTDISDDDFNGIVLSFQEKLDELTTKLTIEVEEVTDDK